MTADTAAEAPSEWQNDSPDWLSGDIASVQRNLEHPNEWKATVAKPGQRSGAFTVVLHGAPDDAVLTLDGSSYASIEGTCGDRFELRAGAQLNAVEVKAPLSKVASRRPHFTVIVPTSEMTVETSGNLLTLNVPRADDASPGSVIARMTAESGPLTLAGAVPVMAATFKTSDQAILQAPLAEGATVEASAKLHLESHPADGILVEADELTMVQRAAPGTYECRVATFQQGVAGSPEVPAVIKQRTPQNDSDEGPLPDTLTVRGDLTRAQVDWHGPIVVQRSTIESGAVTSRGNITVSKDATDSTLNGVDVTVMGNVTGSGVGATGECKVEGAVSGATVEASGRIHVSGNVLGNATDDAGLTSHSDHDFAITVGGNQQQHSTPQFPIFDRSSFDERAALNSAGEGAPVPGRQGGITDARVIATRGGVSCRTASATTFMVSSMLRVQQDIDVDGSIAAGTLRARHIAVTEENQQHLRGVGHLIVDDLTVHGHIETLNKVTCNWLRPPKDQLDVPAVRVESHHIEVLEGVEGRPHLKTSDELAIKSENQDARVTIESTDGHVSIYGFTVARACLSGSDIRAKFRSPVQQLHTTGSCIVDLDGPGCILQGTAAGTLNLHTPPPTDRRIDLASNAPVLTVKDMPEKQNRSRGSEQHRATITLGQGTSLTVATHGGDDESPEVLFGLIHLESRRPAPALKVVDPLGDKKRARAAKPGESRQLRIDAPRGALPTDAPALELEGAIVANISGTIRSLTAVRCGQASPTIVTESTDDSIYDATGDVRLGQFYGTLYAKGGKDAPLVMRYVEDQGAEDVQGTTGKVLDVDITYLTIEHLDRLQPLEIIEPTARSLRALGKRKPQALAGGQHPPAEDVRRDIRALAERARRINQLIESRAVSGSSRAAARWAEARLHHRSINERRWEPKVRSVTWALGYGQRPEFPLATLAIAYTLVVLTRLGCWAVDGVFGYCVGTPMAESSWSTNLATAMSNTFLQPFTLVQFGRDAEALFARELVNLGTSALLGIPFLFLIIALKNYLSLKNT